MADLTVLCGSIPGYYAYRGNAPYLSFTGGGAAGQRAVLPANLAMAAGDVVALDYYHVSEAGQFHFLVDALDAVTPRCLAYITDVAPDTIQHGGEPTRVSLDGVAYRDTVSVTPNAWQRVYIKAMLSCSIGIFGARGGTFISPIKGGIKNISITRSGVTTYYLQQGDQNPNNILPSTPSGSNGTIVGAGWKYQNVSAHYETPTLLNAWLDATVLTGPLTIVDLDRNIPQGTFPQNKDGFPITVIYDINNKSNRTVSIGVGINI